MSNPRLIGACVIIVWTIFIHIIFVGDLVDFVYDGEKRLMIENGNIKEWVMHSNIDKVEYFARQAPRRVTLHLINPNKFGKKYLFHLMPVQMNFFLKEIQLLRS